MTLGGVNIYDGEIINLGYMSLLKFNISLQSLLCLTTVFTRCQYKIYDFIYLNFFLIYPLSYLILIFIVCQSKGYNFIILDFFLLYLQIERTEDDNNLSDESDKWDYYNFYFFNDIGVGLKQLI